LRAADALVGDAEHCGGVEELLIQRADGFVVKGGVDGAGFDD